MKKSKRNLNILFFQLLNDKKEIKVEFLKTPGSQNIPWFLSILKLKIEIDEL